MEGPWTTGKWRGTLPTINKLARLLPDRSDVKLECLTWIIFASAAEMQGKRWTPCNHNTNQSEGGHAWLWEKKDLGHGLALLGRWGVRRAENDGLLSPLTTTVRDEQEEYLMSIRGGRCRKTLAILTCNHSSPAPDLHDPAPARFTWC
jgi:hypothetical protein